MNVSFLVPAPDPALISAAHLRGKSNGRNRSVSVIRLFIREGHLVEVVHQRNRRPGELQPGEIDGDAVERSLANVFHHQISTTSIFSAPRHGMLVARFSF